MTERECIIQKLTEYFSQKSSIDTVVLFGSFAKDTVNVNSDIDIAIHSSKELTFDDLASIQLDLALLCKREIDLADLSKAEGLFLYQIMTTGKRIKYSSTVYVKYLVEALCFKEDFLPTINYMRKEKIRKFINGQ
ncbi:MAG: nucleotidyltransferase domain-containing protein [Fibrobacter sp.]|nr:nucleotidyltransferase domain-containing protein [Fibrobacter sp.]